MEHEMKYLAGLLTSLRSWSPHWYCTCGEWKFWTIPMAQRKTGNNHIEAARSFRVHIGLPLHPPKQPKQPKALPKQPPPPPKPPQQRVYGRLY